MTPKDVFFSELAKTGWAFALVPGCDRHARSDHQNRVIEIGTGMAEHLKWVVGLHELGHVHTEPQFRAEAGPLYWIARTNPHFRYSQEIAAWAWAATVCPPGYEKEFDEAKEIGLKSYTHA
jgi:hypothetical protein